MTEEIIIDECFNCKKKKDIGDNWRTCKLKCSYKYKRKENDYITRLEQENFALTQESQQKSQTICELEQENKELKEQAQLDGECIDKLIEARDMYANALEEIRSIAQDAIDRKFASNSLDYSEGQECIGYYVMDKINEVLGNEKVSD